MSVRALGAAGALVAALGGAAACAAAPGAGTAAPPPLPAGGAVNPGTVSPGTMNPGTVEPGTMSPGVGDSATVADVLAGRVPVGRLVRVRGRCLGYGGRADAGPPPRTRSDWLLGDAGRAVYVVGAFPAGCEPMAGGGAVAVRGRVAVDTLAGLGGPGQQRRYLVGAADARP